MVKNHYLFHLYTDYLSFSTNRFLWSLNSLPSVLRLQLIFLEVTISVSHGEKLIIIIYSHWTQSNRSVYGMHCEIGYGEDYGKLFMVNYEQKPVKLPISIPCISKSVTLYKGSTNMHISWILASEPRPNYTVGGTDQVYSVAMPKINASLTKWGQSLLLRSPRS